MLVLSRKIGEKFKIGDHIWITLVEVQRGRARIGIEAPRDLQIFRQELLPHDPPALDHKQEG